MIFRSIRFSICALLLTLLLGCASSDSAGKESRSKQLDPKPKTEPKPVSALGKSDHRKLSQTRLRLLWRFEFQVDLIRCMAVTAINGKTEYFWYIKYSVENMTDRNRVFALGFEIITDTSNNIITANSAIPAKVVDAVLRQLNNRQVLRPDQIAGRFGKGITKESIAVWRHPAKPFKSLTIFVAGLSDESQHWSYGRYIEVIDKKTGKVVYDAELKTPADRGRVVGGHGKVKFADLLLEEMKKIEGKRAVRKRPDGSTVTIENKADKWLSIYEDAELRITITHYKKDAFDTIMRRTRRVKYEFEQQVGPPDKWKTPRPKMDWILR